MSDSSSDPSGLHDLRALAARAAATRALTTTTTTPHDRVSFPVVLAPVGSELSRVAPVHTPRPRRGFARGMIATFALTLSALAFAMAPQVPASAPVVMTAAMAKQKAPRPAITPIELDASPEPTEPESIAAATGTVASIATASDTVASITVPAPATRARAARVPTAPRRVEPVRPNAPIATTSSPSGDSELGRLLDEALGGRSTVAAGESLPARPNASSLTTTLRSLEPRIARCAPDDAGTATARLVIDGATGRVRSVSWVGATPTSHACMEAVLEDVEVSRFEQSSFSISFPYRLAL